MLFQFAVGFVLTARDFSPGFAVFSPHYVTLPKFPFYRVRTLVISVGLTRYIFNVFASIYLSWMAKERIFLVSGYKTNTSQFQFFLERRNSREARSLGLWIFLEE